MSLVLTIVKSPENILITENSKNIDEQGGTLGRGNDNTWVLQDPDRFLSSIHCQIHCDSGQYILTDLSTNGTYINSVPEPIGKGNWRALKESDVIDLGDYEFKVSFSEASSNSESSSNTLAQQPFGHPFETNDSIPVSSFSSEKYDPLDILDRALEKTNSDDALSDSALWSDTQVENSLIPNDWNDDFGLASGSIDPFIQNQDKAAFGLNSFSEPSMPVEVPGASTIENADIKNYQLRNKLLGDTNRKLRAELEDLKQQLKAAQEVSAPVENLDGTSIDRGFITALGLDNRKVNNEQVAEINIIAGELLREVITGMMKVLGSRNSIKNQFRMNVTTIQPVENNPLKFSANIDDALENMFIKKGNSFIEPVQAFKEGFQSIADHQIAIMTGMKSAFKSVMNRFDPITLEKRFEKQNKGGFLASQKSKNWLAYFEYYNELVDDKEQLFQYLFGDDFVHAYEEELRNLSSNKSEAHSVEDKVEDLDSKEI